MNWFKKLTGFQEENYADTRAKLEISGATLRSRVNGASYGIGHFELKSLQALRQEVGAERSSAGRLGVSIATGNVADLHCDPENSGSLFQVASQFNMLEMVNPSVTPEDGVTRYARDKTQGPACAIAAGAATIYRNYFVPCGGNHGQTSTRQLDGLTALGQTLSGAIGLPVQDLWSMQNGYALATVRGLELVDKHLAALDARQFDDLRGQLRIGLHQDVEVPEAGGHPRPVVSQALCSALPLGYSSVPARNWTRFAPLVLEAAYEATMWAAVLNARRGASNVVFLTFLGGGVFRNPVDWIHAAIRRSLNLVRGYDLDVRLVCYSGPSAAVQKLVAEFQ